MLRDALSTNIYSVENPVVSTFFTDKTSFCENPLALSTDIVVSVATTILPDLIVVELATYNCPPTAFTLSFSNTVVDIVPRIFAFSTSKKPPFAAVNLNPLPATLLANPLDSIVPSCRIIILPPVNASLVIVHPAISFPSPPSFTSSLLVPVPVPSNIFIPYVVVPVNSPILTTSSSCKSNTLILAVLESISNLSVSSLKFGVLISRPSSNIK